MVNSWVERMTLGGSLVLDADRLTHESNTEKVVPMMWKNATHDQKFTLRQETWIPLSRNYDGRWTTCRDFCSTADETSFGNHHAKIPVHAGPLLLEMQTKAVR